MPTQQTIVLERFFDESGGTQLVIHSPWGSRINRAWGLALRKRFCRKFNFELQAAATEDSIVLSLSTSHSFPLEEVARYLNARTARDVLIQAMLVAPMFPARWRWVATTALALPRFRGGKKVAPQLQRMISEDLLAAVFPDQVACAENLAGEREVPDHPLVAQAVRDCLTEAMDVEGLERLLRGIETGAIDVVARDTTEPSPMALEVLSAKPYAFLDDAPLEERRTQAVSSRRWSEGAEAGELGRLDAAAIARVREEAWPLVRSPDELHAALLELTFLTGEEVAAGSASPPRAGALAESGPAWVGHAAALIEAGRATRLVLLAAPPLLVATERVPLFHAALGEVSAVPAVVVPDEFASRTWAKEDALLEIVRGRLGALGPVTVAALGAPLGLRTADIAAALARMEVEGTAMRGYFTPGAADIEWCERGLLARIHRHTLKRLRQEIEPVEPRDFMRFLFEWQRVAPGTHAEGSEALVAVLALLEGYEAPAAAWESEILPARLRAYDFTWLDDLCLAGRIAWRRLSPPSLPAEREHAGGPVRTTPIALLPRRELALWTALAAARQAAPPLSARAQRLHELLVRDGASFFDEMLDGTRMLRTELEEALGELVAAGQISSDSFMGLRALVSPAERRPGWGRSSRRGRRGLPGVQDAGRWSLTRRGPAGEPPAVDPGAVEHIARVLLRRYGVVCWRMLEREAAWLPPWRELLRVYHRLEARGEIRGGRFIAGLSGEQFALPDAVGMLRKIRRQPHAGTIVTLCGADPLNLTGSVLPGARVPALTGARILFRDGVPLATLVAKEVRFLEPLESGEEWALRKVLLRDTARRMSEEPVEPVDRTD